jgi:hypothetical protein
MMGSSEATIVISMEGKGPWELTYSDGSTDFTIPGQYGYL